jgi:phosphotransferase system enzyme I (PtsP)
MTPASTTYESGLLLTLEEISQLVSHGHDPRETLSNIVRLIQRRFATDVCSVYLLEPERGELVLGATVGLDPQSVGRVRMGLNEGLTGLVAERMAPVMVSDAFQHPRFKYFPEAGEDPYHSFLGVPLVEGGALQGVLVVQTLEPRPFSPNETRMLVTVGSQLASLVSGARLLEQIEAAAHELPGEPEASAAGAAEPAVLTGVGLGPGVGVGQAYRINGPEDLEPQARPRSTDLAAEKQRLAWAMDAARDELTRLSQRISELVGEDHGAILQAQLMIMQDRVIEQDLIDCMAAGSSAEAALAQTQAKYVAALQKVNSAFFQERVYDLKDVFRRLLWHLRPRAAPTGTATERLVLVAHEASVLDLFSVDFGRLAGVVVEHGGPQSHAAILARSLGVPMVSQVADLFRHVKAGRRLRVDGGKGLVHLDPPEDVPSVGTAAPSADIGEEILRPGLPRVEVNVNLLCEVAQAVKQRASGVGLYRSEFLFLARRTLPTEEEQVGIYRKLVEQLPGRPVTIRTFDLRPDKLAHSAHLAAGYPFDWRLVLESPPLRQLFKDQVRAILRAAAAGPVRILVPLVVRTEQLDFILDTLAQARAELNRDGLEFGRRVPLGVMIEVAAATAMVETWADQVEFFALGTNDLVASALGIDRDNPVGSPPDPLHPGVLRLLEGVVESAHRAGRGVTVCGEMAADPEGTLVLAALGVDALSVAVNQLAAVRRALAGQEPDRLAALAPQLSRLRTAGQVRALLRQEVGS